MYFDLSVLSPSEFEALSADLIGRDIDLRFERFGDGPDGGVDGRHAKGPKRIILQAKHYNLSGFSQLERAMREERSKVDRLEPSRYILSTSVSMTPLRKAKLKDIIGSALVDLGDVYGKEDLKGLLRNYQDIAEAHPALWQTSGRVIESVLNSVCQKTPRQSPISRRFIIFN